MKKRELCLEDGRKFCIQSDKGKTKLLLSEKKIKINPTCLYHQPILLCVGFKHGMTFHLPTEMVISG